MQQLTTIFVAFFLFVHVFAPAEATTFCDCGQGKEVLKPGEECAGNCAISTIRDKRTTSNTTFCICGTRARALKPGEECPGHCAKSIIRDTRSLSSTVDAAADLRDRFVKHWAADEMEEWSERTWKKIEFLQMKLMN